MCGLFPGDGHWTLHVLEIDDVPKRQCGTRKVVEEAAEQRSTFEFPLYSFYFCKFNFFYGFSQAVGYYKVF